MLPSQLNLTAAQKAELDKLVFKNVPAARPIIVAQTPTPTPSPAPSSKPSSVVSAGTSGATTGATIASTPAPTPSYGSSPTSSVGGGSLPVLSTEQKGDIIKLMATTDIPFTTVIKMVSNPAPPPLVSTPAPPTVVTPTPPTPQGPTIEEIINTGLGSSYINRQITGRPDEPFHVTWEKPSGETITIYVKGKSLNTIFDKIQNENQGAILKVVNENNEVFFQQPSTKEKMSYLVEHFQTTSIVPSDVSNQVEIDTSDASQQKYFAGYPGEVERYERISYGESLGLDMSKEVSELNKYYNIWASDKDISGNRIVSVTKTSEQQWQEWHSSAMQQNPIATTARDVAGSFLSIFDPNTYGAIYAGNLQEHIHSKDIANVQQIKSEGGWSWDVWKNIQVPAYENVILPMAGGYALGLAFPSLVGIGTAGSAVTKTGQTMVKTGQIIIVGGVMGATGASIGATAAFEEHGMVPKGSTVSAIFGTSMQFAAMGVGTYGAKIDYPRYQESLTTFKGNVKQAFYENVPLANRIMDGEKGVVSFQQDGVANNKMLLEKMQGFGTRYVDAFRDLGFTKEVRTPVIKQGPGLEARVTKQVHVETKKVSVGTVIDEISGFKQDALYFRSIKGQGSNWESPSFFQRVADVTSGLKTRFVGTGIPSDYTSYPTQKILDVRTRYGGRPLPYEEYYDYAVPTLEQHISDVAARKQNYERMMPLRRTQNISTETIMRINPDNPLEATFLSHEIGSERYAYGKIDMLTGELRDTGLYPRRPIHNIFDVEVEVFNPKNKFEIHRTPEDYMYRGRPITGVVKSEFVAESGDINFYRTMGVTRDLSEKIPLYGYYEKIIDTGYTSKGLSVSDSTNMAIGWSAQKDVFASAGKPGRYGFISGADEDYSIVFSSGKYISRNIKGTYGDIAVVEKPKPKTGSLIDTSGPSIGVVKTPAPALSDLFTGGGMLRFKGDMITKQFGGNISLIKEQFGGYPTSSRRTGVTLAELEEMERGIIQMPVPPISRTDTISKQSMNLLVGPRTILGQISFDVQQIGNIDLTDTSMKQLSVNLTETSLMQKQVSLQKTESLTIQTQMLEQVSLQKTALKTVTALVTTNTLVPPQITTVLNPLAIPVDITVGEPRIRIRPPWPTIYLDLEDEQPQIAEMDRQGYIVMVKDRVYVKGKKTYADKYIPVFKQPLNERDALSLMGTVLNESAAATGYIKPVEGKPKSLPFMVDPWSYLQNMFYTKEGKYIEKTEHRINTQGEIQGISALGWVSEKKKQETPVPQIKRYRLDAEMGKVEIPDMNLTLDDLYKKMLKGGTFGF
jgi:hypothetical protein